MSQTTSSHDTPTNANLHSITLMIAAMGFFTIADLLIKIASETMPVGQVMLVLGLGSTIVFLILMRMKKEPVLLAPLLQPAMLLRNSGDFIGSTSMCLALAYVPISTIGAVIQAVPLMLTAAVALFQVNEFSALVAIVLYAIVPLIRYTEHGLRHVPPTLIEAARANGCSPLQRLVMIELPVARPAILLGLNQTVLFALAMLIIAVLVGARGLAEQVNIGLRDADTGLGMTAGLSMAFIAIIADRILRGYANTLGTTDISD